MPVDMESLTRRYDAIRPHLTERQRRLWLGNEARELTETGLKVNAVLDKGTYPTGIKISDEAMKALPLTRHETHGQWNYTLTPPTDTPEPEDFESR